MKSRFVEINYLIDSTECLLLENLAKLDTDIDEGECSKPEYFDKNIFNKLFKRLGKEDSHSFFLKNKYLYYLTGGTLGYLDAIYSMLEEVKTIDKIEKSAIISLIKNQSIKVLDYDFVSLGCGEGYKDLSIINHLYSDYNVNYIPIDISPSLLQLTINKFKNAKKDKVNIIGINCDFYDLNETALVKLETGRPKIIALLGGTIGNYSEKNLLQIFSRIMNNEDYFFVSFELYDNIEELNKNITRYYTSGNMEFLTNPLKLIPSYKGYLDNSRTKYFKFMQNSFEENELVTDVPEARSYVPKFRIPQREDTIFVAWSTKYKKNNLISFLKNLDFIDFIDAHADGNRLVALLRKKDIKGADEYEIEKNKALIRLQSLLSKDSENSEIIQKCINDINNNRLITIHLKEINAPNNTGTVIIHKLKNYGYK